MDAEKTGRLIRRLREEKGMTQVQLGERLHISHKTVSKWETGGGAPDISLLPALGEVLGVEVKALLEGDMGEQPEANGNLRKMRFLCLPPVQTAAAERRARGYKLLRPETGVTSPAKTRCCPSAYRISLGWKLAAGKRSSYGAGPLYLFCGLSYRGRSNAQKALSGMGYANPAALFCPRTAALVLHGAWSVLSEHIGERIKVCPESRWTLRALLFGANANKFDAEAVSIFFQGRADILAAAT